MSTVKQHTSTKLWLLDIIVITILGIVFFSLFLGAYPLRLPDEGRYAEVAREMLSQHNFITPTLNGVVFFDKPPLYYWLSAMAMHIGGVNEWMARAAPALFGLFSIVGIYITGRLLDNRRTGLIAAGILATTPLYFLAAHFANCDLIVAACISLSLWSTLIAIVRPELTCRRLAMFSAYFWCALAVLAKGLIGIVFPIAIVGAFILIFNHWTFVKSMYLIPGVLLVLLLILPWFILVSQANTEFLHYFFYIQQYQRFISQNFNDQEPLWFYIPIIILGSWPWVLYIIQAIKQSITRPLHQNSNHVNGFLLIWIAIIFIFFSIPASKTIGYMIPIFPPIALLIARYIAALPSGKLQRFPAIISILTLFLAGCVLIIGPHVIHLHISIILTSCLGIGLLLLSVIGVYVYHRTHAIFVIIMLINMILLLSALVFANLGSEFSVKPFALWLNKNHISAENVYVYYRYPFDLPFYLQAPINVVNTNWQDPSLTNEDSWQGEFAYGLQQKPQSDAHFVNQSDFITKWSSKTPIYVLIPIKQIASFQTTVDSNRLVPLMTSKHWWLVSNKTQ